MQALIDNQKYEQAIKFSNSLLNLKIKNDWMMYCFCYATVMKEQNLESVILKDWLTQESFSDYHAKFIEEIFIGEFANKLILQNDFKFLLEFRNLVYEKKYSVALEKLSLFVKDFESIFKSFIANATIVDGAYSISKMVTFDVNSSQAKYWYNDFLDLEAKLDDEANTKKAFDEINVRVLTPIKKESKDDYWCLYNATLRYMRSEGEFDIEYYANEILGKYTPTNTNVKIKDLSKKALELPGKRNFDKKFTKVPKAIKKKIKAIIPLTEDISLSVTDNGNPSLKNVIKPHKDEEGHKYIMVKSDEGYSYANGL